MVKSSLKTFLSMFLVLVLVSCSLLFVAASAFTLFQLVLYSSGITGGIIIMAIGLKVVARLRVVVRKATSEELRREDDVLLEAVAFSQSILVVLVNIAMSGWYTNFPTFIIVMVAISFYILRAWAKIKDSSELRYFSMIIFAFMAGVNVASIGTVLSMPYPSIDYFFFFAPIFGSLFFIFQAFAENIFTRRYDIKGFSFLSEIFATD